MQFSFLALKQFGVIIIHVITLIFYSSGLVEIILGCILWPLKENEFDTPGLHGFTQYESDEIACILRVLNIWPTGEKTAHQRVQSHP